MYSSTSRPKWWQLYLTFPLLIALFLVEHHLSLSQNGHIAAQTGILLLIYGLVHLWLRANAAHLSSLHRRQYRGRVSVIRVPASQLPEANDDKQPLFQLPDSEIKGVLSSTFELGYIDADGFPVDEVSE